MLKTKVGATIGDKPLVVSLWPEAGQALGLGRNATYEAARRGEIKTLKFGRLLKVSVAWLLQKCGHPVQPDSNGGAE